MRDVAWASVGRPAARPRRRLPHPRRLLTPTLPPTRPTRRQPRRYYATLRITNIALGKTESILLRPNSEETTTAVSLARGDNPNSFSLSFPPSPLSLPRCFSLLPLLSCSSFDSLFGWLSFDLSLFFTHTPTPFRLYPSLLTFLISISLTFFDIVNSLFLRSVFHSHAYHFIRLIPPRTFPLPFAFRSFLFYSSASLMFPSLCLAHPRQPFSPSFSHAYSALRPFLVFHPLHAILLHFRPLLQF